MQKKEPTGETNILLQRKQQHRCVPASVRFKSDSITASQCGLRLHLTLAVSEGRCRLELRVITKQLQPNTEKHKHACSSARRVLKAAS